ncbi:ribonuclease HII [Roseibacterium sp. SDUM158016]|uniref:ribonuclease HII n=1 Tax=Roseicyclus sediminis TaxID=2980997 RepID=UPI0021CF57D5|nr:ribonuclease HII [Roseibacterium sp. SDUM158016]MCU4652421.1 ribonuclease HII [Roseibacterium sp. SDUM158016]
MPKRALIFPDFTHEAALVAAGAAPVAGVDEVGRGPLAGPVTAAAVILDPARIPEGLNDSKSLSAKRRAALVEALSDTAEVAVGWASVEEIDTLNIRNAAFLAMCRAVAGLPRVPGHVLVDGNACPRDMPCPATPLVKGDARSLSIAAASIVAKVARDAVMAELDEAFPGYGWATNAGYPTAAHRAALQHLGVTPHHRRSFAPVHQMLWG